jgi:hypothetical protein
LPSGYSYKVLVKVAIILMMSQLLMGHLVQALVTQRERKNLSIFLTGKIGRILRKILPEKKKGYSSIKDSWKKNFHDMYKASRRKVRKTNIYSRWISLSIGQSNNEVLPKNRLKNLFTDICEALWTWRGVTQDALTEKSNVP